MSVTILCDSTLLPVCITVFFCLRMIVWVYVLCMCNPANWQPKSNKLMFSKLVTFIFSWSLLGVMGWCPLLDIYRRTRPSASTTISSSHSLSAPQWHDSVLGPVEVILYTEDWRLVCIMRTYLSCLVDIHFTTICLPMTISSMIL